MSTLRTAVLGLGSNLGGRASILRAALALLAQAPSLRVTARSSCYENAPLGPAQPRYFNAAARVETALSPAAILDLARSVEQRLGRERRERWGPRTLDVDVLWVDGVVSRDDALTVPHPGLLEREFALRPLLEVAPDAVDPRDGVALSRALAALTPDPSLTASPLGDGFATEHLEHTADEGFVVRARDRADLLAAAAEALGSLIVDPATVRPTERVEVSLTVDPEAGDDERMFGWLCEVLHHLDGRRLALHRAAVLDDGAHVRAVLLGEALDEGRHGVRSAVKAITWHTLDVGEAEAGAWRAQVVVDV